MIGPFLNREKFTLNEDKRNTVNPNMTSPTNHVPIYQVFNFSAHFREKFTLVGIYMADCEGRYFKRMVLKVVGLKGRV